jgi:hypothetical protein
MVMTREPVLAVLSGDTTVGLVVTVPAVALAGAAPAGSTHRSVVKTKRVITPREK